MGSLASLQTPVARVLNLDRVKVEIALIDDEIRQVEVGQRVRLTVDASPEKALVGQVTAVGSRAAPGTLIFPVRAGSVNRDRHGPMLPGVIARIPIRVRHHEQVLAIPGRPSTTRTGILRPYWPRRAEPASVASPWARTKSSGSWCPPGSNRGTGRYASLVEAGILRLRPIILTSESTIGGLLPVAMGLGGRWEVWAPLANTLIWGLLFSTLLTRLIIPAVCMILAHDLAAPIRRRIRSTLRLRDAVSHPEYGDPQLSEHSTPEVSR